MLHTLDSIHGTGSWFREKGLILRTAISTADEVRELTALQTQALTRKMLRCRIKKSQTWVFSRLNVPVRNRRLDAAARLHNTMDTEVPSRTGRSQLVCRRKLSFSALSLSSGHLSNILAVIAIRTSIEFISGPMLLEEFGELQGSIRCHGSPEQSMTALNQYSQWQVQKAIQEMRRR